MTPHDVMATLERLAEPSPWPGFDPRTVPVALYDGESTLLFRHPQPPPEFQPDAGTAYRCAGRHPAVTANTVAAIGDVPTATVMIPSDGTAVTVAAVVAHEAFHVFQSRRHPAWWGCDEGQAMTYPVTSLPLHRLLLQELEALEQALAAAEPGPWVRLALALRQERYALLAPGAAAYERCTERLEGLAHYVEAQVAAQAYARRPLAFSPDEVRRRSYTVGYALATLLDRFDPSWKARLTEFDTSFLDELLAEALPPDLEPAALPEATLAALDVRAEAEVAEVSARRQALLGAFATRAGWRLEVIAPATAPLRPRGFDPMNLHVVMEGQVLHTRYLRLGTDAGSIEHFGQTLTEAAGPHPLFQGVLRMVITGLEEAPTVSRTEEAITLTAPGLQATFQGAGLRQSGQSIIITLREAQ